MLSRLVGLVWLPLVLLNAALCVYGQDSPHPAGADAQNTPEKLSRMHEAWGRKASTQNASLTIKESGRDGKTIKFRLYADGVPTSSADSIVTWPVTQRGPSEILKGVTLDKSGLAVCAGTPGTCGSADKPNDPVDVNFQPIPGEPVRLGLISSDGMTKVFAKLVPVPLQGQDGVCTVDATLLTPGAELVSIEGSGFPPSAEITIDSDSEGEHLSGKGRADADGRYKSIFLPYKQGVARGTLKINLKSAACSPSVSISWGKRN